MSETEQPFSSTTWEWRRVKIRRPAGGQNGSAPKALRWYRFPPRNPREPLHLTVKFRGGPECWYEVHARGSSGRYIGSTAIHDIMVEINRTLGD